MVWEKWSLKQSYFSVVSSFQNEHCDGSEIHTTAEADSKHETTHIAEVSCVAEPSAQGSNGQQEYIEQDPLFEEEWDCLEECLLSRWSSFSCLNVKQRFEEAEAVLNSLCENINDQKRNTMKSRIISLLFRQLSSLLTLTRNQNDHLISFLKEMITFIMPEKEDISRRIFASQTSCQRQSLKDRERRFVLCRKYMDECLFFSFAVDTAVFRNEDLVSCTGRFCFDNNALEIPLFICTCAVSSGKENAVFFSKS